MILHNKRGINGKETQSIVIVASFMNAVFNIEQKYESKETFTIIENGEPRHLLLHHLTNADLQTAIILLKICNLKGHIFQTTPHVIYKMIQDYFEAPISVSQFYSSFKKFTLHQLITTRYDSITNRFDYQLNYYLNSATGKVGYYVIIPPLIFSRSFTKLSIAKKKLFFSIALQQGDRKQQRPSIERKLYSINENVQYSGLCHFLHRHDPYHLKQIFSELKQDHVYRSEPLFTKAELIKRRNSNDYYKAIFTINPNIMSTESNGNYHEYIPITVKQKRKANLIHRILEEEQVGELIVKNRGLEFASLVSLLHPYRNTAIRYAIKQLKEYRNKNNKWPHSISRYLQSQLRHHTIHEILLIARKTNVSPYISPGLRDRFKKEREWEFASKLQHYPLKHIEKGCDQALPILEAWFQKRAQDVLTYKDYCVRKELQHLKGIDVVRKTAYRNLVCPDAYTRIEEKSITKYKKTVQMNLKTSHLFDWMLGQIERADRVTTVPVVPWYFRLEQFLIHKIFPRLHSSN